MPFFVCVCVLLMLTSHGSAALYVVKVLRGAPPADTKKGKVADGAAAAASEVCLNILLTVPGADGNVAGGSLGLSWHVFVRVCSWGSWVTWTWLGSPPPSGRL